MTRFMLDTNTVSYLVKGRLRDMSTLDAIPRGDICISAVTEAELLHGIARRPQAHALAKLIHDFLGSLDSLPFDSETAQAFALLRVDMARAGKSLTHLDMLIAAHARSIDATLVTSDRAFTHVPGLRVENWA